MRYPVDHLTADERQRLRPHVTHEDRPVFGLVDLPETVKGAVFARYSRFPGTLRRLLVDEFGDELVGGTAADRAPGEGPEGTRARELYERIFLGYGDDSVAQLGGAHVAAEWCSNVLTKVLQRPRLAAYLEQSTRYIAYDTEIGPAAGDPAGTTGGYRYYRDDALAEATGGAYTRDMDALFATYSSLLPRTIAWCAERYPAPDGTPAAAHERAIRAKALDLLRGLLPASTLSHVGIFASGQAYESLILHLLAHPLPEARRYGGWILDAIEAMTPSFVSRVRRPDRGGRWVEYLRERESAADRWAGRIGLSSADAADRDADDGRPSVRLVHVEGDEDDLLAGLLYEASGVDERRTLAAVRATPPDERGRMLADLVGERENRRHRPGRGLERLRYRFEIVSDYGAFRDLQRHRMLTVQWQGLTPELGAGVPDELVEAGLDGEVRAAYDRSAAAWAALDGAGLRREASYAVCLGFRIRYVLDLNARAAMQLVELRSGREGHPSYRAVAHEMHRLIGEAHPAVGAAMRHVDHESEPRLERLLSEMRTAARGG